GVQTCALPICAVEAHRDMAERRERREVAAGPAAEVQDDEGRFALDVAQQLGDVLADVVVARAQPEVLRPALVVRKRERAGLPGWPAVRCHARLSRTGAPAAV